MLGVDYFIGDLGSATATVLERVRSSRGGYSCLCGVHGIVTAQHSESLMEALHDAWLNFPDGAPVAWLMRRLGAEGARRVAGPDLMPRVIDAGQDAGVRHYLYGSTPEVLERLEQRLLERYPRAIIAGSMSPPFRDLTDEENDRIAAEIAASGADVVWVGLGLPKQDEWLRRNAAVIAPAVGLGVGAAFDFLSETKARAPQVGARRGPGVAAPAGERAAPARPPLRRDEHGVPGPRRDRHHGPIRPRRRPAAERPRPGRRSAAMSGPRPAQVP